MSTIIKIEPSETNCSEKTTNGLRVIGAGLPRTGTLSLKVALEILGFGPCHHMRDIVRNPDRAIEFTRAYNGEKVDFRKLMQGYGSTVDAPTSDFYKELHQIYPEAKIILSVRETGEKWFESFQNTIGAIVASEFYQFSVYLLRFLRFRNIMVMKMFKHWNTKYGPIDPSLHEKYNRQVINENKQDNLLVYNVKEGWEPLCKFLKVDVPQGIPFPHVNDAKEFNRGVASAQFTGLCRWILVGVLMILLILFIMRIV